MEGGADVGEAAGAGTVVLKEKGCLALLYPALPCGNNGEYFLIFRYFFRKNLLFFGLLSVCSSIIIGESEGYLSGTALRKSW